MLSPGCRGASFSYDGSMWYEITAQPGYLRCVLFDRQSIEQTQEFLAALSAEILERQCSRVLISVHDSKPIFTVEKYGLVSYFDLALRIPLRVAILGDCEELRIAHRYVESLAAQRGVNLRTFREEAEALDWLKAGYARA